MIDTSYLGANVTRGRDIARTKGSGVSLDDKSLRRHPKRFSSCSVLARRADVRTIFVTRDRRDFSYRCSAVSILFSLWRHRARTTASSSASDAPIPKLGSIGWAASPTSVTHPLVHDTIEGILKIGWSRISTSGVAIKSSGIGWCHSPKCRSSVAFRPPASGSASARFFVAYQR